MSSKSLESSLEVSIDVNDILLYHGVLEDQELRRLVEEANDLDGEWNWVLREFTYTTGFLFWKRVRHSYSIYFRLPGTDEYLIMLLAKRDGARWTNRYWGSRSEVANFFQGYNYGRYRSSH